MSPELISTLQSLLGSGLAGESQPLSFDIVPGRSVCSEGSSTWAPSVEGLLQEQPFLEYFFPTVSNPSPFSVSIYKKKGGSYLESN